MLSCIFSIIIPVFRITWCIRNHYNMLIWFLAIKLHVSTFDFFLDPFKRFKLKRTECICNINLLKHCTEGEQTCYVPIMLCILQGLVSKLGIDIYRSMETRGQLLPAGLVTHYVTRAELRTGEGEESERATAGQQQIKYTIPIIITFTCGGVYKQHNNTKNARARCSLTLTQWR